MKAAVIGTQYNISHDAHSILRSAGIKGIQKMAGLIPAKIPVQPLYLDPVEAPFVDRALGLMMQLSEAPLLACNPRVPYLFLAWLLVGEDNHYRATQYVDDDRVVRYVALTLISIACGEAPTILRLETIRRAASRIPSSATWKAAGVAVNAAMNNRMEADRVVSAIAWTASNRILHTRLRIPKYPLEIVKHLQQRARDWCMMSDVEIIQLLTRMVWDVYPVVRVPNSD